MVSKDRHSRKPDGRRRKRVLMVHQGAELYGSDRVFAEVVHLVGDLADPVVILDSDGPLREELLGHGACVQILPLGVLRRGNLTPDGALRTAAQVARATLHLTQLIRRSRVDLVYTSTISVMPGALAALLTRRPHVWHVHEIVCRPKWLARGLAAAVGSMSDVAVCISDAVAANLVAWSPLAAPKVMVVHNGVRPPDLREAPVVAARKAVGKAANQFTIAMVGRISSWKGQEYLLDALSAVDAAVLARMQVLIVGDCFRGNESVVRRLKIKAAELDLDNVVRFLGFRSDVTELVAASDVVVVPSTLPEPFGLVAVEGMLLGKPVVGTNLGGLREIVVDGVTGFLVPAGEPEVFAHRLERLAGDPALARRMGREGEARARTEFAHERFACDIRRVFTEALTR